MLMCTQHSENFIHQRKCFVCLLSGIEDINTSKIKKLENMQHIHEMITYNEFYSRNIQSTGISLFMVQKLLSHINISNDSFSHYSLKIIITILNKTEDNSETYSLIQFIATQIQNEQTCHVGIKILSTIQNSVPVVNKIISQNATVMNDIARLLVCRDKAISMTAFNSLYHIFTCAEEEMQNYPQEYHKALLFVAIAKLDDCGHDHMLLLNVIAKVVRICPSCVSDQLISSLEKFIKYNLVSKNPKFVKNTLEFINSLVYNQTVSDLIQQQIFECLLTDFIFETLVLPDPEILNLAVRILTLLLDFTNFVAQRSIEMEMLIAGFSFATSLKREDLIQSFTCILTKILKKTNRNTTLFGSLKSITTTIDLLSQALGTKSCQPNALKCYNLIIKNENESQRCIIDENIRSSFVNQVVESIEHFPQIFDEDLNILITNVITLWDEEIKIGDDVTHLYEILIQKWFLPLKKYVGNLDQQAHLGFLQLCSKGLDIFGGNIRHFLISNGFIEYLINIQHYFRNEQLVELNTSLFVLFVADSDNVEDVHVISNIFFSFPFNISLMEMLLEGRDLSFFATIVILCAYNHKYEIVPSNDVLLLSMQILRDQNSSFDRSHFERILALLSIISRCREDESVVSLGCLLGQLLEVRDFDVRLTFDLIRLLFLAYSVDQCHKFVCQRALLKWLENADDDDIALSASLLSKNKDFEAIMLELMGHNIVYGKCVHILREGIKHSDEGICNSVVRSLGQMCKFDNTEEIMILIDRIMVVSEFGVEMLSLLDPLAEIEENICLTYNLCKIVCCNEIYDNERLMLALLNFLICLSSKTHLPSRYLITKCIVSTCLDVFSNLYSFCRNCHVKSCINILLSLAEETNFQKEIIKRMNSAQLVDQLDDSSTALRISALILITKIYSWEPAFGDWDSPKVIKRLIFLLHKFINIIDHQNEIQYLFTDLTVGCCEAFVVHCDKNNPSNSSFLRKSSWNNTIIQMMVSNPGPLDRVVVRFLSLLFTGEPQVNNVIIDNLIERLMGDPNCSENYKLLQLLKDYCCPEWKEKLQEKIEECVSPLPIYSKVVRFRTIQQTIIAYDNYVSHVNL